MVEMTSFYRLLVVMGGSLWALNALIALMLHNGGSDMLLNLYFCNSFFLDFDWLLENNGPLLSFKLMGGVTWFNAINIVFDL